jgi:hypothetical protein
MGYLGPKLKNYKLYGTSACHLCELAQAMTMAEELLRADLVVEDVDISESDILMERYGVRIPVLRHPDGRELNWPFTQAQVRNLLIS